VGRALLINPSYFRTYGSNEGGIAFPVYPVLSLASLAGAALERGHDATILDLSYRRYDPDLLRQVIRDVRPDVVGITATTPLANQMRDISYLVKDVSPDIITVGGGAHPTALPRETLGQSALDAVAVGEADFLLAELLDHGHPDRLDGVALRRGDDVIETAPAPLLDDLDALPMPAWEIYPREGGARVTRIVARHRPVATVEFSRGCLYRCDFCGSKNTMGMGYRKKSPARCAEELVRLAALGYREVVVNDDIFTSDNEWAAAVCEEIIRRRPGIAWTCNNGIRVDSATDELFTLMQRAGCYRVYFGFESGSDEVIRSFGKGGRATLDRGIEAVDKARRAGLEPNGFFLVGLTADTEETMQQTIDYAKRVRLDTMKCGLCIPFPGTPMFRELNRAGHIRTFDWDAYTVYNDAEAIFDHPRLSWSTISHYFRRFYIEAYLRNPAYLWRRFRFMIKNNEVFWNAYYTVKFWMLLRRSPTAASEERYAYEDRWRPLDLDPATVLGDVAVPRGRRGSGPTGRDGVVTVLGVTPRKRVPTH
jgi:anaerobic magnesium-protoporphyrin IX monomethyl ester cyclase